DAKIQMVDELTEYDVTFSKVAAGQTQELQGAKLTVRDENGDVVETWTSTGTAKVLKLTAGEYTMIEDQAPLGYEIAESITFRVNPDGSVEIKEGANWVNAAAAKIQMVDKPTPRPTDPPTPIYPTLKVPLKAQKVLKNGSLKAGEFTFQLKDKNGNVIAEAKNAADGTVTFPDRTFSKEVSNYIYTIQEVAGTNSKVTYDKTVYTVKVSTKAVDGKLEATVNVEKDGVPYAGSMTFTNRVAMPQTGDSQPQLMFILALSGLVALMVGILLRKKRES
ncbi:MAG: LPXTG cell wall anchor domain-containing protein, partial [Clostridiales bacterium]|nr:LPXTG cell wall anchor domain-containing protein [Clostridiales bacterium]